MGTKKIKQTVGITMATIGLVIGLSGGFAGAQSASIEETGPDSDNAVVYKTSAEVEVENENDIAARNANNQVAVTGEAESEHNTTGGDAETGSAENENSFKAKINIDNAASSLGEMNTAPENGNLSSSIETTGPDSDNKIIVKSDVEIEIENENDLHICNTNTQTATTGDAEVEGNTTGGDAITGDASNESTTSLTFTVSN